MVETINTLTHYYCILLIVRAGHQKFINKISCQHMRWHGNNASGTVASLAINID